MLKLSRLFSKTRGTHRPAPQVSAAAAAPAGALPHDRAHAPAQSTACAKPAMPAEARTRTAPRGTQMRPARGKGGVPVAVLRKALPLRFAKLEAGSDEFLFR